jgi:hypothetical protein
VVFPILISVSLAPVSYFLSARALPLAAAKAAIATESAAILSLCLADIASS